MKVLVVCGNGLGSSFIAEINVKKALNELNIEAEVNHTDLASAKAETVDYYIGSPEILEQLEGNGRKLIPLINLFNVGEIKTVLEKYLGAK